MICDVISRGDLEAYVFGEAEPRVARLVEAHLFGCVECAAELRQIRSERRLFRARLDEPAPAVPSFDDVLARIAEEPSAAVPPFDDVVARIADEPRSAVPSFDDVLARIEARGDSAGGAWPVAARTGAEADLAGNAPPLASNEARRSPRAVEKKRARRASRTFAGFAAVIAAAAAIGWIFARGASAPPERAGASASPDDATEIVAESVCGSGEPDDTVPEDVRVPVSQEPIASVELSPPRRRAEPVARAEDAVACAAREVCAAAEAQMTYACEDQSALCACRQ